MLVWSVFFQFLPKCLFVVVIYAYFIDISQSSVEMLLLCGGIYNNDIIVNCLQSVPVKEDMDKSKVARFFGPSCTSWMWVWYNSTEQLGLYYFDFLVRLNYLIWN